MNTYDIIKQAIDLKGKNNRFIKCLTETHDELTVIVFNLMSRHNLIINESSSNDFIDLFFSDITINQAVKIVKERQFNLKEKEILIDYTKDCVHSNLKKINKI